MNQNEHHQFADLKTLLKLKQHEVPPPGYFNHFSDEVISRIRAGEAGGRQTVMERLETEAPWLVSFLRIFETRPGLIGGFATSLCLLLVLVVVFAERSEHAAKNLLTLSDPAASENAAVSMTSPSLVAASGTSGIVASTNPVTSLQPATTLFGEAGGSSLFQPAGFMAAGR